MNALDQNDSQAFLAGERAQLLAPGFEDLRALSSSICEMQSALQNLKELAESNTQRRIERLDRQIVGFEPSVTMIGQIKSGKTSLVNAMIGMPDLLPADVNPWTSVVTSLHLHPEDAGIEERASFQFFDTEEWDRLVSGGGRMGELASRAGADAELDKIKEQVAQMRRKSRERLGRKFEMLLGQRRDYGYIDKELIERFVCLGDDFDADTHTSNSDDQGRFADITKSADLAMSSNVFPIRMCIRDTPGVNDTFMMREQITIRSIRDSRICVVVLSAHQALSSTDLALIRLITNVKSRDVVIFVNRVDELSDPQAQIPQIQSSIEATLKRHKGPEDAQLVFGSALWANYALNGNIDQLPAASQLALLNWQGAQENQITADDRLLINSEIAFRASGVADLQRAIARRIVEGPGASLLQKVSASGQNLASGLAAANRIKVRMEVSSARPELAPHEAREALTAIMTEQRTALVSVYDALMTTSQDRMKRAQDSFVERATVSLVNHLESNGDQSSWTYDPTGLRVLLSSAQRVLSRKSRSGFDEILGATIERLKQHYVRSFGAIAEGIEISPPHAPRVPPPVSLGRTIALDLSASWWKRWWLQRRGYEAYAQSFRDLIQSETDPIVSELIEDVAHAVKDEALSIFGSFLNEQLAVFESLEQSCTGSPQNLKGMASQEQVSRRQERLEQTTVLFNKWIRS